MIYNQMKQYNKKDITEDLVDITSIKEKGDMPGDQIHIKKEHVRKAIKIFNRLSDELLVNKTSYGNKVIISVYGGSGVGKSEIGSVLAHLFNRVGIGSYVLSGDNYPHRIPEDNDEKRMYVYNTFGKIALEAYLGSEQEINFAEVNSILADFKSEKNSISLKRMGRTKDSIHHETVDMTDVNVLILEWTHGNNGHLKGVDIPIFLNSTPEETLEHRKNRNRDGNTDTPFIAMVLDIEQQMLERQKENAWLIVSKQGEVHINDHSKKEATIDYGPMLNAYPDSIGGNLSHMIEFLKEPGLSNVFSGFYILPSVFHSDLDRGFSIIDYELNQHYATQTDLDTLKSMGISTKMDFVLNHKSVLSKEFQDIIKKGEDSEYYDFFIDWNGFWAGYGKKSEDGHIIPESKYIDKMFFRKPGLPILKVYLPDGQEVPFWNTFYQEVRYRNIEPEDIMDITELQYTKASILANSINTYLNTGEFIKNYCFDGYLEYKEEIIQMVEKKRLYLGQMDLNLKSDLVWAFYEETLKKLAGYGAKIVRLDAFAYASKEPGEKNFFNEPDTWTILSRLNEMATQYGLTLLPEIHTKYEEKVHEQISNHGYMTYDFFLPGLIIDAFEHRTVKHLMNWIEDILDKDIKTVNMLGCHDGIPLLDLKGLLPNDRIQHLIDIVVKRGGIVKDLHGKKNMYYQVNATYFSALGEIEEYLLLARAIQMFMPGKPQIWYLDLLGGKNDYEAIKNGGSGVHKEINRTNITTEEAINRLNQPIVQKQLELIRFRNTSKAFKGKPTITITSDTDTRLCIKWASKEATATLDINLEDMTYKIGEK